MLQVRVALEEIHELAWKYTRDSLSALGATKDRIFWHQFYLDRVLQPYPGCLYLYFQPIFGLHFPDSGPSQPQSQKQIFDYTRGLLKVSTYIQAEEWWVICRKWKISPPLWWRDFDRDLIEIFPHIYHRITSYMAFEGGKYFFLLV